jgi:hypothetical protein
MMRLHWARTAITLACLALPTFGHAGVITLGTAANYAVFGLAGLHALVGYRLDRPGGDVMQAARLICYRSTQGFAVLGSSVPAGY